MGRGEGKINAQTTARRAGAPVEEGEIAALDADRLEDLTGVAAKPQATGTRFGDADDDRAIRGMIAQLKRTPSGRSLSDEQLEDRAIAMYNAVCENISSGKASEDQVLRAAQIFGESPTELRGRLAAAE